jgi:hypothetical protein
MFLNFSGSYLWCRMQDAAHKYALYTIYRVLFND